MSDDSSRIDKIVSALHEYWIQNPDLRLGQMISNLHALGRQNTDSKADIFYTTDREWLRWLKQNTK